MWGVDRFSGSGIEAAGQSDAQLPLQILNVSLQPLFRDRVERAVKVRARLFELPLQFSPIVFVHEQSLPATNHSPSSRFQHPCFKLIKLECAERRLAPAERCSAGYRRRAGAFSPGCYWPTAMLPFSGQSYLGADRPHQQPILGRRAPGECLKHAAAHRAHEPPVLLPRRRLAPLKKRSTVAYSLFA